MSYEIRVVRIDSCSDEVIAEKTEDCVADGWEPYEIKQGKDTLGEKEVLLLFRRKRIDHRVWVAIYDGGIIEGPYASRYDAEMSTWSSGVHRKPGFIRVDRRWSEEIPDEGGRWSRIVHAVNAHVDDPVMEPDKEIVTIPKNVFPTSEDISFHRNSLGVPYPYYWPQRESGLRSGLVEHYIDGLTYSYVAEVENRLWRGYGETREPATPQNASGTVSRIDLGHEGDAIVSLSETINFDAQDNMSRDGIMGDGNNSVLEGREEPQITIGYSVSSQQLPGRGQASYGGEPLQRQRREERSIADLLGDPWYSV